MENKKNNNKVGLIIIVIICIYFICKIIGGLFNTVSNFVDDISYSNSFVILSSYENKSVEDEVVKYAKKNDISVKFKYMGDLDIVEELNNNSSDYDAVWISNSMWLYMLNNSYLYSDSKSISISPVVFGIRKSKAEELGLVGKDVTNTDILNLIKEKKISYVMNSVTQTNTGATAYLGFLQSLAGNPEVLTEDMINNPELISNLKDVFSGVERVSGDESYLKTMFLNNDDYEAVIASESSLIDINNSLKSDNKEQLYLIYPTDGVAINDSTFAFIDNDKDYEEDFLKIQNYLLSDDGQEMLAASGQRTWYGGVSTTSDKKVFNPDWGIDTSKYLNVTKFPSKAMITASLNLYIEQLRKPTHVVFCLDYSGSMSGDGISELRSAMDYILTYENASKDKLQFSENDKITVIPFSSSVLGTWDSNTGKDTTELLRKIKVQEVRGSTALYYAIEDGLDILNDESDDYTKTIIAMTDGEVNVGTFEDLQSKYKSLKSNVPIYSITFGDANEYQLEKIADLSNAKVFDGKSNLLSAFKEVRSYN